MSKYKGFILLYRDIKNHWIWDEKPFDKKSAWIDLIMSANWNGNKVMIDMEVVNIKRGEFITSQEKLSIRWGWSTTKVRAFLEMLEKNGMVVLKKDRKKTGIEIVNYDEYQNIETAKKLQINCEKTTEKLQKNTNNTYKDINKEKEKKEIYGEFKNVFLTAEEYDKLKEKFNGTLSDKIEKLSTYMESKGIKYKSHYATILNWSRKEPDQPVKDVFSAKNCINPQNPDEVILPSGGIVPKYRCKFIDGKWSEK